MKVVYDFQDFTDVALYKPAFQSSLSRFSNKLGARGALQADSINNEFSFHTDKERHPWWYVDLICIYPIDYIVIFDRVNYSDLSKSIEVEISEDFINWQVVHKGIICFDNVGHPFILPLSGKINIRFIRLSISSNDKDVYFHLKKVSAFIKLKSLPKAESLVTNNFENFPNTIHRLNKLKVCIIGTSNSIMKGYVSALENLDCHIVKNVSVGSSHSSVIPYRLDQLENTSFDYLIIDIFVNENRAYSKEFYLGNTTEEILLYMKDWCSKNKVIPIILIMPTNFNQNIDFLETTIEWCNNYNLLYFNGISFLEKFCNVYNRTYDSCFSDPAHMTIFLSRVLGRVLNEILLGLKLDSLNHSEIKNQFCNGLSVFQYMPFTESDLPMIKRQNRIFYESFITLSENEVITLNVQKGCTLEGVVINMAKSHGVLEVKTTENSFIKRLDNDYYDEERDLWLVVWNFQTKLKLSTGLVEFSCKNLNILTNNLDYEDNDHRDQTVSDRPVVLEIAGIIVKYPKQSVYFIYEELGDVNLIGKVDDSFLKNLF